MYLVKLHNNGVPFDEPKIQNEHELNKRHFLDKKRTGEIMENPKKKHQKL